MKRIWESEKIQFWILVGVVALYFVTIPASKAITTPREPQRVGFFAPLEKGQKISLKETAHGFEITAISDVELGFTITEIGNDYIVVEDIAKVAETRIPVYSIRSIKTVKFKVK